MVMSRQREKDFQGCLRCRVGKKKCDQRREKCSFCMNNKYECLYPSDWPEVNFTILGKIGRASKEATLLNFQQIYHALETSSASLNDHQAGVQPSITPSESISSFVEGLVEDLIGEFFKGQNDRADLTSSKSWSIWGLIDFIDRETPFSVTCLVALASEIFVSKYGSSERTTHADESIDRVCLDRVDEVLKDHCSYSICDPLISTYLLIILQIFYPTGNHSWEETSLRLGRLIESQGPEYFARPTNRLLLETCCLPIIYASTLYCKPTFLAEKNWKIIPWCLQNIQSNLQRRLINILTDMPGLLKNCTVFPEDVRLQRNQDQLIDNIKATWRELHRWRKDWEDYKTHAYWDADVTPAANTSHRRPASIRPCDFDSFNSVWEILHYNFALITICKAAAPIQNGFWRYPLLLPTTEIPSPRPQNNRLNPAALPTSQLEKKDFTAALEICRCVEYAICNVRFGRGIALHVSMPIHAATQALGNIPEAHWLRSIQESLIGRSTLVTMHE